MIKTNFQKDGSLDIDLCVPLLFLEWDSGYALEYRDPESKNVFIIEPACRDDEFMGTASTIETFHSAGELDSAITLELNEHELVKCTRLRCDEDENNVGISIRITANVPPNKHRVLASVEYVWPDQPESAATS